jgi:hypothetical protein
MCRLHDAERAIVKLSFTGLNPVTLNSILTLDQLIPDQKNLCSCLLGCFFSTVFYLIFFFFGCYSPVPLAPGQGLYFLSFFVVSCGGRRMNTELKKD